METQRNEPTAHDETRTAMATQETGCGATSSMAATAGMGGLPTPSWIATSSILKGGELRAAIRLKP